MEFGTGDSSSFSAFLSERELVYFPYVALVRWPEIPEDPWSFNRGSVIIRNWLEGSVGPYIRFWSWSHLPHQRWDQCCVAFRQDQHRTLFVLRWDS